VRLQVFFTPLSQALRLIIHLGEPLPEDRLEEFSFSYSALGLFFVLPYVLMMWTNGVGASTGMFVPALAVGATGECQHKQHLPALGFPEGIVCEVILAFKACPQVLVHLDESDRA